MPNRLEIALNPDFFDAEGEGIRQKAFHYFGLKLSQVRAINILTIDADLTADQLKTIQTEIFTNPVTQTSSFDPVPVEFDWIIWVGFRPGVRDNPGSTAVEAIEDILRIKFKPGEAIYTSKRYCLKGKGLTSEDVDKIAGELLANDTIQRWKIFSQGNWDPEEGIGFIIPKVMLDHVPCVTSISIDSDETLKRISDKRNLALNPNDIQTIRAYFLDSKIPAERAIVGLSGPTDIDLE